MKKKCCYKWKHYASWSRDGVFFNFKIFLENVKKNMSIFSFAFEIALFVNMFFSACEGDEIPSLSLSLSFSLSLSLS